MPRLVFEKTGRAVWISHLDLMRVFQRAFKRAGFCLTHTQGFNPRPSVSIALPLSVGIHSHCELLDFELLDDHPSGEELVKKLNSALVEGVRVVGIVEAGRKLKDLTHLRCTVTMEYASSLPANAADRLKALFQQPQLTVLKKGKNGPAEQDIIPLIKQIDIRTAGDYKLEMDALIRCQNPSLNPMQILSAVEKYLPELVPDSVQFCRQELYDLNGDIFR